MRAVPRSGHHKKADTVSVREPQINNLDLLVEIAAVQGQLSTGVSPSIVAVQSSLGTKGVTALSGRSGEGIRRSKEPSWSPKEDKFLEDNLGILSLEDIAAALGRSEVAVKIRRKRDLQLIAPSKSKDIMSCQQIANGLGVDGKSVHLLFDRGLLEGWRLPTERVIRVVDRITLLRFLVNPMHWCYFRPERIGLRKQTARHLTSYDVEFWSHARRLVLKKKKLWEDEWWTIGQASRYYGVDSRSVNKAIHEGRLKAIDWGNWWLLRSVVTDPTFRIQAYQGKGGKGHEFLKLNLKAEAFLLLGIAVGLQYAEVGALMGWRDKRIAFLISRLRKQGRIQQVIKASGLEIFYSRKTGEVFADWKMYRGRFPRLARTMDALEQKEKLTRSELKHFNSVKRKAECFIEVRSRKPRERR